MNNKLIKEMIALLEMLKKDAEMAIDGRWDCTTTEGIEEGFGSQIVMIDEMLTKLKNQ